MNAQILPETKCLRLKPCLLQFYQNKLFLTLCVADGGSKVNAEHRQIVVSVIAVLMRTNLNGQHFNL